MRTRLLRLRITLGLLVVSLPILLRGIDWGAAIPGIFAVALIVQMALVADRYG